MLPTPGGVPGSLSLKREALAALTSTGVVRPTIVALLFLGTTINYMDRAILGVLKSTLDRDLGWSQIDYGWMVTAFQVTYAGGYLLAGRWFDRVGVRFGLLIAVSAWSLAASAHALAHTVTSFIVARGFLGLAEGGFFPAAVKAVAEWFPRETRAFATGLFNSGSNAGALICPVIVPLLAARWGWRGAFFLLGVLGFVWVILWIRLYPRANSAVSPAFRRETVLAPPSEQDHTIRWRELVRHRQTWAYVAGTMASAPVWWFYIFWAPDFFNQRYGLNLDQSSLPLVAIFLVAGLGGICGGWLSSFLLRRGWTLHAARKATLLICALCAVPVFAAPLSANYIIADALVALAAAAHCGFAANLYTLASDTVPAKAVASVVGIGGMAGAVTGIFFAQFISRILALMHNNYLMPFSLAACSYLLGLGAIQLLLPRWDAMKLHLDPATSAAKQENS